MTLMFLNLLILKLFSNRLKTARVIIITVERTITILVQKKIRNLVILMFLIEIEIGRGIKVRRKDKANPNPGQEPKIISTISPKRGNIDLNTYLFINYINLLYYLFIFLFNITINVKKGRGEKKSN